MAHAHCMLVAEAYKYRHSGCAVLIALPLQQWLHERATLLRNSTLPVLLVIKPFRKTVVLPCSGRKYETDLLLQLY